MGKHKKTPKKVPKKSPANTFCYNCKCNLEKQSGFKAHNKSLHKKDTCECKVCGTKFRFAKELEKHEKEEDH